jgi:hypothetical protein
VGAAARTERDGVGKRVARGQAHRQAGGKGIAAPVGVGGGPGRAHGVPGMGPLVLFEPCPAAGSVGDGPCTGRNLEFSGRDLLIGVRGAGDEDVALDPRLGEDTPPTRSDDQRRRRPACGEGRRVASGEVDGVHARQVFPPELVVGAWRERHADERDGPVTGRSGHGNRPGLGVGARGGAHRDPVPGEHHMGGIGSRVGAQCGEEVGVGAQVRGLDRGNRPASCRFVEGVLERPDLPGPRKRTERVGCPLDVAHDRHARAPGHVSSSSAGAP